MRLRTLDGGKPHESYKGWARFLKTCELRGGCRGVKFYGKVNCNFAVFPCGVIVQNFGSFQANVLMADVKKFGPERILDLIKANRKEMAALLQKLKARKEERETTK